MNEKNKDQEPKEEPKEKNPFEDLVNEEMSKPPKELEKMDLENNPFNLPQKKETELPAINDDEEEEEMTFLEGFIGKDFAGTANEMLKSVSKLIEAQAQRQIDKTEIEKEQLKNQIEISKINLEIRKENNRSIEEEQKWVAGFDKRNKFYSGLALIGVAIFVYILASQKLIDQQALALIIGAMVTIIGVANKDVLGRFGNKGGDNNSTKGKE